MSSQQEHKWYIIHTSSNSEKRVKQAILDSAAKKSISHLFAEIEIPAVGSSKLQRGKEVKVEKKIMPGYILIKMVMNEDTWQLVKAIPQVSHFLGSGSKPSVVPEEQVQHILDQQNVEQSALDVYEIGDVVLIKEGPFETFNGVVDEVDNAKSRLRVSVSIFGRSTPIELNFSQVQKNSRL